MSTLEDRLRDAFRADADTVRPEMIPGLREQVADGYGVAGHGRSRRKRLAIPLAAAAAVAVIAVTASVVVPGILSGQPNRVPAPSGSIAQGYPGDRVPGGPRPRFFVAIMPSSRSSGLVNAAALEVFSSETGRLVGRLAPPPPGRYFQAVAALGNDRTFVAEAAAAHGVCRTWLYRFRLTPGGQPTGLAPLAVPEVAGRANPSALLAASADGKVIAYDTTACTETAASIVRDYGQVGVIHLGSGKVTAWTYRSPATPLDLSLSADGSQLAMVSNPSNGTWESSSQFNSAWVLRTDAAPGQLARRYRKVVPEPPGLGEVGAEALSPTGAVMYASTTSSVLGRSFRMTLGAYQTATGRLIRVWHVFPRLGDTSDGLGVSSDVSGRYLLVFQWTDRIEMLDLATGRLSKVPGTASGASSSTMAADVAW